MCQHSCFRYPPCKAHAPYLCTVICGLSGCNVCFHIIWETARFSEGEKRASYWTQNVFSFSVQLLSEKFLILRRIQRDTVTKVHRASCKVRVLLSDLNETWIFLVDFRKILKGLNFMKIRPMGARRTHRWTQTDTRMDTDGHTDGHRWTQTDTPMDTDGHTHRQTLRI